MTRKQRASPWALVSAGVTEGFFFFPLQTALPVPRVPQKCGLPYG